MVIVVNRCCFECDNLMTLLDIDKENYCENSTCDNPEFIDVDSKKIDCKACLEIPCADFEPCPQTS